ncbi:MAG: hypothetical protein ABIP48_09645, partial [Planctomycetota bacterium]
RLEPINSVARIIEDHIGFQGYLSNGAQVDPVNTNGLFDISSSQALSTHVRAFDLSDVLLYVNTNDSLEAVNPLFGDQIYTIDSDLTLTNQEMRDIVMRSDGQLYGYQRLLNTTNTAGRLVTINHATGALTTVGTDNIQGETAPYVDSINSDMDDLTITDDVGAVTFRRNLVGSSPFREGYYAVYENELDADGYRNSKLYRFNADTGAIQNGSFDTGFANIQLASVSYATSTITVRDNATPTANTTTITLQARAAGANGNGISISVSSGGGTLVTSTGRSISISVSATTTAQAIVDAINTHSNAKLLVQAARTSNNNTTANNATTPISTSGGITGGGTPLKGNVTGLAFSQFTGGTLYGITNRGEFISIDRDNGAATMVYNFDVDPQGLNVGTDFQGLSLGPQNVHGGLFSDTFFAINSGGDLVAFRPNAGSIVPVLAFGGDNEVQNLRLTSGSVTPSNTFRLSFTSDRFGTFTTAPIPANASATQVRNALQALATPGGVPIIASGDVTVSGAGLAAPGFTIQFTGFFQDKDVAQLSVDNSGMTSGSAGTSTVFQGGDGIRETHVVSTGVSGATGLAFSPLDANLWHPTTRLGSEAGHGINAPYDLSRTPEAEARTHADGDSSSSDSAYNQNEGQGGVSFYFGLENYVDSNTNPYLNYETNRAQLGIQNNEVQRDLTSTSTIGNNYDLPGGAYGSLTTDPFDLVSSTLSEDADDRPTLYFNYRLHTDGTNTAASSSGDMKDSARVYLSSDGGRTWNLLATNNSPRSYTADTELPSFASHSRFADSADGRQRIQELYETATPTGTVYWRQARV